MILGCWMRWWCSRGREERDETALWRRICSSINECLRLFVLLLLCCFCRVWWRCFVFGFFWVCWVFEWFVCVGVFVVRWDSSVLSASTRRGSTEFLSISLILRVLFMSIKLLILIGMLCSFENVWCRWCVWCRVCSSLLEVEIGDCAIRAAFESCFLLYVLKCNFKFNLMYYFMGKFFCIIIKFWLIKICFLLLFVVDARVIRRCSCLCLCFRRRLIWTSLWDWGIKLLRMCLLWSLEFFFIWVCFWVLFVWF